jgi:hypothetical protein
MLALKYRIVLKEYNNLYLYVPYHRDYINNKLEKNILKELFRKGKS